MKNCLSNFFLTVLVTMVFSCIFMTTINAIETVATRTVVLANPNLLVIGKFLVALPVMGVAMGIMVMLKTKATWPVFMLELGWTWLTGFPEKNSDTALMFVAASVVYLLIAWTSGARMHLVNIAIGNFRKGRPNLGGLMLGFFYSLNKTSLIIGVGFSLLFLGSPDILIACLIGTIFGGEALQGFFGQPND